MLALQKRLLSALIPSKLSIKVKLVFQPAGIEFDLDGSGTHNYFDFNKSNITSTGSEQEVTITASNELPVTVCTVEDSIEWHVTGGNVGLPVLVDESGPHKVYITYGTPAGSVCTETRIRWLCDKCDGEYELEGIADCIWTAFSGPKGTTPEFQLSDPNVPNQLWLLLESTDYQGACNHLANLMRLAIELMGGSASIGYVYGSSDTDCFSTSTSAHETRTCPGGSHGVEKILVWDGEAEGWNNWECVCLVNSKCYAVKIEKGTALQILLTWLGANNPPSGNFQAWRYAGQTCTDPGPYPAPKPE